MSAVTSTTTNMNHDDLVTLGEALAKLDSVSHVYLTGEVAVEVNGRHIGYLRFNGSTETEFSQRPSA